jgi:peroxiredoxin Q/BCP
MADSPDALQMANRSELIPVGEIAPDFTAAASDGTTTRLADLRGRNRVILVFYPGDNTPVCTAQLCAFRDDWRDLQTLDAVVYGINPASVEKHQRFANRHSFPFPLLSDPGGRIAAAYGCRGLFGWPRRAVYVVDRQGRVVYAQRGNPSVAEIKKVLRQTQDREASR